MRQISLVISLIVGVLTAPLIALAAAPPPEQGGIHLVIAPVARASLIVTRAGGVEISPISAPLAVLAVSEDPDFAMNLRAAGAWLVLDGRVAARLCGVSS